MYSYRFLLLFFSCTLISFITNAQILAPRSGYYIDNAGDTTYTQINLEAEAIMARNITVIETTGTQRAIPAQDLKEVNFPELNLILQRVEHDYFSETEERSITAVPRLATLLMKSTLSLYRLGLHEEEYRKINLDLPPIAYYLRLEDGNFVKLDVEERQITGVRSDRRDNYKAKLQYVMRDWPAARNRIDKLYFNDAGMIKLLEDYLAYRGLSTQVVAQKVATTRFQVYGIYGTSTNPAAILDRPPAIGLGFAVHLYNPQFSNRLIIQTGLEYWQLQPPTNSTDPVWSFTSGYSLRTPITMSYLLSENANNKNLFRTNGGFSFIYSKYRLTRKSFNQRKQDGKNLHFPFHVGFGADLGKLTLDAEYQNYAGLLVKLGYKF